MGIGRRKDQGRSAVEPELTGTQRHWRNILRLPGSAIESGYLAAVNQIGIQRIRRDITVFLHAHRIPVTKSDLAEIAAAGRAHTAALLLSAINPVWKLAVGDHVMELRGWLVVPRAPGLAAVHADGRALIDSQGDDLRIFRVDPDGMVIVPAGSTLNGGESCAAIIRSIGGDVRNPDCILIFRIHLHAGEVVPTSPDSRIVVDQLPVLSSIF